MRDSGLDVSYASTSCKQLKKKELLLKMHLKTILTVGTFEELIPTADLVLNLNTR